MSGAELRIDYARKRLKKLHAEMLAIDEQLGKDDLPRATRDLLKAAKRSKVQSAARWAEMIVDLEHDCGQPA
jgi:hypothetical protein